MPIHLATRVPNQAKANSSTVIAELADQFLASLELPPPKHIWNTNPRKQIEKQLILQLGELRDSMLSEVPRAEKKSLDISFDLWGEPENATVDREFFSDFSKLILPGREDLGTFKMFGGLTATGSPWFEFAANLFSLCGIRTEVHTLEGHDGDWQHFSNATNKKWVEQILDTVKENDIPFPLSTSGNAFCQALKIKPDLCKAVVGVGWPLVLKNAHHEHLMEMLRVYTGPLKGAFKLVSTRYPRSEDATEQPCPQFIRMPISVAIELRISQVEAMNAIFTSRAKAGNGYNFPPFFYAQGKNDAPVSPVVPEFLRTGIIRSPLKIIPELYERSDHTVQSGKDMYKLLKDVLGFLKQVYQMEGIPSSELPRALAA